MCRLEDIDPQSFQCVGSCQLHVEHIHSSVEMEYHEMLFWLGIVSDHCTVKTCADDIILTVDW